MQILCTICSDIVSHTENTYVTKCGHLFHHHCLSQWISRSKTCPQCRNKVTDRCMFRIFPTISSDVTVEDATTLQSRLDDAQLQLRQNRAAHNELQDKLKAANEQVHRTMELLKNNEKKLVTKESAISALKEQLDYVKIQNKETNQLKEENDTLKKNMQTLNALQKVLNATSEEVEEMLQGYSDVRTIATFATALKRALCESESKKSISRERLQASRALLASERASAAAATQAISSLREQNESLKSELESLQQKLAQPARAKRKVCEDMETAFICDDSSPYPSSPRSPHDDTSPPTKLRRSDSAPTQRDSLNEDSAMDSADPSSLRFMVRRIESADSPYLSLQAAGGLPPLPSHPLLQLRNYRVPSESKLRSAVTSCRFSENQKPHQFSIFPSERGVRGSGGVREATGARRPLADASFDGLGGHARPDVFPVSRRIPRLTSKHRLQRPPASIKASNQTITDMLNRLHDNQRS